ncbi:MAG: hypothetical protein R2789_09835 [Microthrixaceae bacterium]
MPVSAVPSAVLLDAGVFAPCRIRLRVLSAFARAECDVDPSALTGACLLGRRRFTFTDIDVEMGWTEAWLGYLRTYIDACGWT